MSQSPPRGGLPPEFARMKIPKVGQTAHLHAFMCQVVGTCTCGGTIPFVIDDPKKLGACPTCERRFFIREIRLKNDGRGIELHVEVARIERPRENGQGGGPQLVVP